MGLEEIQAFAEAVTKAGALAASAFAVLKMAIALAKRCHAFLTRPARIEAMMEGILHELKPNGSSSLRDAVDRMEARQILGDQVRALSLNAQGFGVFQTDAIGLCTDVNKIYQRLTGRTVEELLGNGWVNAIHPDDYETAVDGWNAAVDDQRDYQANYRYVRPDESIVEVHCTAHPVKDRKGEITGYVGFVKEIGRG